MGIESTDTVRAILRELHAHGAIARTELARLTSLTDSAVSRNTRRLIDSDVLKEGRKIKSPGQVGRRHVELTFGRGAVVAGIGIRAFEQWVQIMDIGGKVLAEDVFSAPDVTNVAAVLTLCSDRLERLIENNSLSRDNIIGIGVSIVGVIDVDHGEVLHADNLGWGRVSVASYFRERHAIPVTVESYLNSLNLLINGLPRVDGARRSVLLVLVAVGIGSSLLLNGRLIRGQNFSAGQIGHVAVPGENELCACGRRGCLDTVASGKALLARLQDPDAAHLPAFNAYPHAPKAFLELSQRAITEEAVAQAIFDAGLQLGRTLATIAAATDPSQILCSGFVCANDTYFRGICAGIDARRDPRAPSNMEVVRDNAPGRNAPAALALQYFVFGPAPASEDRLALILAA